VNCSAACAIDVNGALEGHNRFFIEPGRRVTVTAEFPGGRLSEEAGGAAGGSQELSFTAPPPPPEPAPGAQPVALTGGSAPSESGRHGLPRPVFWTALGITAAAGGVLIWSGVDTLSGVDAYEANPTPDRLSAGQDKERRTNALIGVTSGLAATTLLLAIFTDWHGDDDDDQGTRASVSFSQGGAMLDLEGHF
jgi:hypothetical protein